MKTIELKFSIFKNWKIFDEEFAKIFGFPDFYGKNMDAWIDCMSYLDDPDSGMTTINLTPNDLLEFKIVEYKNDTEFFKSEIFQEFALCCFFINNRFKESDSETRLIITIR